AMTRYVELAESPLIAERLPLIREAIGYVGDVQVRNRGTIGGSLAQADPTGEMPLCCLVLDAEVVIRGAGGERRLGVDAFITGSYATVLEPDELVVEIRFPPAPPVSAFAETGRKHNDF